MQGFRTSGMHTGPHFSLFSLSLSTLLLFRTPYMGVLTAGGFRLHEKRLATRMRYKGRTPQTPGQRTDRKSSLEEPDDPGPVPSHHATTKTDFMIVMVVQPSSQHLHGGI